MAAKKMAADSGSQQKMSFSKKKGSNQKNMPYITKTPNEDMTSMISNKKFRNINTWANQLIHRKYMAIRWVTLTVDNEG